SRAPSPDPLSPRPSPLRPDLDRNTPVGSGRCHIIAPMTVIRATRAEIDLAALRHNAGVLRRAAGGTAMAAVVKADAYGHGAVEVARALGGLCERFAVSLIEEGIELRDAGVAEPILVMGPSLAGGHRELVERGLTAVVSDPA